jgi:hypothetical protein
MRLEGRSFNELAAATGLSVNTLLSRKHYAVLHLRRRLASYLRRIQEGMRVKNNERHWLLRGLKILVRCAGGNGIQLCGHVAMELADAGHLRPAHHQLLASFGLWC